MAEPTSDEPAGRRLVKTLLVALLFWVGVSSYLRMAERRREAAERQSRAPAGLTPEQSRDIFGK